MPSAHIRTDRHMTLSIICAMAKNRTIGVNDGLPWHLPEDLKRFKALTMGKPMVMGRKTYDSIGRPLPGRTTIVVTRQADWASPGVIVCGTIDEAIAAANQQLTDGQSEIMVVGGEEVYRQCLPLAKHLYLTEIDAHIEGDTFFPELKMAEWEEIALEEGYSSAAHLHYRFLTLERR